MNIPFPSMRGGSTRRTFAKATLVLWFIAMSMVATALLARHALPLPSPRGASTPVAALSSLKSPDEAGRWTVFHVIYSECRCSQAIVEHLVTTTRPRDVTEHVLLVGNSAIMTERLASRGFKVTHVTATELGARFKVEAAPMLFVLSPDGDARYAGGYTERKQGPSIRDLSIIDAARSARTFDSLPVFGCAVSERLRRILNPISAR